MGGHAEAIDSIRTKDSSARISKQSCRPLRRGSTSVNDPVFQGITLQDPVLQGPIVQGALLHGTVANGGHVGLFVAVTKPSEERIAIR